MVCGLIAGNFILVNGYEVIYALNAGGDAFTDENKIHYDADTLKVGTSSDFGKQLPSIGRVSDWNEEIYRTERYHTSSFGYDIPANGDGDYALVLKFSEVYFNAPNMKVFDVKLNGEHTVVDQLDIYQLVGKGVAHDEIIPFTISRGRLYYKEEESEIRGGGRIHIEFVKSTRDNPKINGIVLFKGTPKELENIPKIQPMDEYREQLQQQHQQNINPNGIGNDAFLFDQQQRNRRESEAMPTAPKRIRKTSGPKQMDPYALDDSTVMLPVFIAIGAFIPLMFCLCKL